MSILAMGVSARSSQILHPTRIILQSRLSSARLPAKGLLPVAGFPSVVLAAKRAGNQGLSVCVATSNDTSDDWTQACLASHGVSCVRGPLDDVLHRFILATEDLPDEAWIIRLTADNLFPDGPFLQDLLEQFEVIYTAGGHYAGTSSPEDGLPYGLSAEIFTVFSLREAQRKATTAYEREHVTPWIVAQWGRKIFDSSFLGFESNLSHLRCTMDTFEDYLRICSVFEGMVDPVGVSVKALSEKLANPTKTSLLLQFPRQEMSSQNNTFKGASREGSSRCRFTMGTVQLGLPYGRSNKTGQPSQDTATHLIQKALALGVDCLDTARAYGDSEQVIGVALDAITASQGFSRGVSQGVLPDIACNAFPLSVITKLSPLSGLEADASVKTVNDAVDASVFRSCRELRNYRLHTLLLHRGDQLDAWGGSAWNRLLTLQSQGVIQRLGVSIQTPEEGFKALENPKVEHLQLPFNLLDWRWRESGFIQELKNRPDVTVHARSVLLQGVLSLKSEEWPKIQGLQPAGWIEKMEEMVVSLNRESVIDLCFGYALSQTWIHSLVIGIETEAQLQENLRLFQHPPLSSTEAAWVEAKMGGALPELLNPALWPA
jgi:spore coat polysaccharide biosynthesis protein SpsF (cytidylyltransferase family)/aryl-alcohol dehydrogenase-like predicted oxidoreductase